MSENITGFDPEAYHDFLNLESVEWHDFHAKNTIVFGELILDGWDWGKDEWESYSLSSEAEAIVRPRINKKIEERFFDREIGSTPVSRFKRRLLFNLNNVMSDQGFIYSKMFSDSSIDLFEVQHTLTKEQDIFSEFPQAQLMTDVEDYATHGSFKSVDSITNGDILDKIEKLNKDFQEPDKKVLDYIDKCFSRILSRNF